jgi:predicted Zn-dependent protease
VSRSPEQYRERAQAAAGAGDLPRARTTLEEALAQFPDNPAIANSAGNLAMRAGDAAAAEKHFARALELGPGALEFAVNRAIALGRLERDCEAVALLEAYRTPGSDDPRYCSTRAKSERALGRLGNAAQWYDRCLALAPTHPRALHGRARVALERGEADAVARFERALAANRMDPEAWLGLAEALDAAGKAERARGIAEQLVAQAPHWIEALRLLAQLRLAAGDADFAGHFAEAARQRPDDPAIARAHVAVLDGHDSAQEAFEVAAEAHRRFSDAPQLALLEAVQAGVAGDDDRAEAIFAALDLSTPERWLQEARHRLRRSELERADELLDRVLTDMPWNISAWALRDCLWRLSGDDRSAWLHHQPELVQLPPLPAGEEVLAAVVPVLHRLHDGSAFPLGQSLRGGTQTRGNLFQRTEPELARLQETLMAALEDYRAKLPPVDPAHPLLRHRDASWAITGSWSVRLSGGGDYHAPHLHPQGIISSALYCELPDGLGDKEDRPGWIELGRPAPDLRLDLEPLYALQPRQAHLALFPSTLYHGTRPFTEGRRLTVAFDVTMADPAAL